MSGRRDPAAAFFVFAFSTPTGALLALILARLSRALDSPSERQQVKWTQNLGPGA